MAKILIYSLLLGGATIAMKILYKNTGEIFLFGNFIALVLYFFFFQFVNVPESRINIIFCLNFTGVWWIKLTMLFDRFS